MPKYRFCIDLKRATEEDKREFNIRYIDGESWENPQEKSNYHLNTSIRFALKDLGYAIPPSLGLDLTSDEWQYINAEPPIKEDDVEKLEIKVHIPIKIF